MISYTVQITLSLKYVKPLIFPMGVIVFMLSLLPDSMMAMLGIEEMLVRYSFIPVFALFVIFAIVNFRIERSTECENCH